jgi:hypothetical protein
VVHSDWSLNWRPPGGIPERSKGTGCKPVGSAFEGSNPSPTITPSGRSTCPADSAVAGRASQPSGGSDKIPSMLAGAEVFTEFDAFVTPSPRIIGLGASRFRGLR